MKPFPECEAELDGHADRPYQLPSQAIWDSLSGVNEDIYDTELDILELTAERWMEGVHGEVAQRVATLG